MGTPVSAALVFKCSGNNAAGGPATPGVHKRQNTFQKTFLL
jgi:hypothetical protein